MRLAKLPVQGQIDRQHVDARLRPRSPASAARCWLSITLANPLGSSTAGLGDPRHLPQRAGRRQRADPSRWPRRSPGRPESVSSASGFSFFSRSTSCCHAVVQLLRRGAQVRAARSRGVVAVARRPRAGAEDRPGWKTAGRSARDRPPRRLRPVTRLPPLASGNSAWATPVITSG